MKRIIAFILLLLMVAAVWYFSLRFSISALGTVDGAEFNPHIFSVMGILFSALALFSIIFLLILLTLDTRSNQINLAKIHLSNQKHLEVLALTSLIQECDTTLYRYDRWEEAGIKGDYMNARASVRDKMNAYRENLERKYTEIQAMDS